MEFLFVEYDIRPIPCAENNYSCYAAYDVPVTPCTRDNPICRSKNVCNTKNVCVSRYNPIPIDPPCPSYTLVDM